jgi:hypothetical protein
LLEFYRYAKKREKGGMMCPCCKQEMKGNAQTVGDGSQRSEVRTRPDSEADIIAELNRLRKKALDKKNTMCILQEMEVLKNENERLH